MLFYKGLGLKAIAFYLSERYLQFDLKNICFEFCFSIVCRFIIVMVKSIR